MQQTRLDQGLKRKYAYRTHVFTHRLPEGIKYPKPKETSKSSISKYQYEFIFECGKEAQDFINYLKSNQLLYASTVKAKNTLASKCLCRKKESFTFTVVRLGLLFLLVLTLGVWMYDFFTKPENQKIINEAWEEFQRIRKL